MVESDTYDDSDAHSANHSVQEVRNRPGQWADWADEENPEERDRPAERVDAARVLRVAEDMRTVRNFFNSKADIAEAYSPPRITKEGRKQGFECGFALDLIVPEDAQAEVVETFQRAETLHAGGVPAMHSVFNPSKHERQNARGQEEG